MLCNMKVMGIAIVGSLENRTQEHVKETRWDGDQKKNRDHPDYCTSKINSDTLESPRESEENDCHLGSNEKPAFWAGEQNSQGFRPSRPQHYRDRLECWKESWWSEKTACHSNFSEWNLLKLHLAGARGVTAILVGNGPVERGSNPRWGCFHLTPWIRHKSDNSPTS